MDAERFERMCREVLQKVDIPPEVKAKIIQTYADEYRAYAERAMS
jgi:hypothetical protein